jgi:fibronectin-binding autotransporter adhesin
MRRAHLLLAFAAGIALTLIILVALNLDVVSAAPAPTIRYVLGDGGTDTGNCTDPDAPCETIQYAVSKAYDGDVIRVASKYSPVTYTGTVVIAKSITLEGSWRAIPGSSPGFIWERITPCDASRTTIDASGAGRAISITGNITPTVDCFTITGGDATGLGGGLYGNDAGGGISSRDAAPIIVNNVITANYACLAGSVDGGRGGGIYLLNAPATTVISNNLIAYNVADGPGYPISGQGGGIMLQNSDAQVLSNTIEYNLAGGEGGLGGGIAVYGGSPTIADNVISRNTGGQDIVGSGGGIFVRASTPVTIERNTIESNYASYFFGASIIGHGGGVYFWGDHMGVAIIRDNVIKTNAASVSSPEFLGRGGGGIYLGAVVTPSVVSGNTIENNYGNWQGSGGHGGGIYVLDSVVTIQGNDLVYNHATWSGDQGVGGGLYIEGGVVVVQSNVISNNQGAYFSGGSSLSVSLGGGIAISNSVTTVRDNWIERNHARGAAVTYAYPGKGGAIYAYSSTLQIEGNTVANNIAAWEDGYGSGGGIYITHSPAATLLNNHIHGNTDSDTGGGIAIIASDGATLANNQIHDNVAKKQGGGIYLEGNADVELMGNHIYSNTAARDGGGLLIQGGKNTTLVNNMVVENYLTEEDRGAGILLLDTTAYFEHTTLARNSGKAGAGVYLADGAAAWVTNTLVASHTVGIYVDSGCLVVMEGTLWGDGAWANTTNWDGSGDLKEGEIVITGDPDFVAPDDGDYHIGPASAAIDAGVPTTVDDDIDGDSRPIGPGVDIGADEAWRWVFLPLVLRNY